MAVPDGMTKLVVSGTLAGGTEKFAFSLWHSGYNAPGTTGGIDLTLLEADAVWQAFITNLEVLMTTGDSITQYDAYWYQGGVATAHSQLAVTHAGTGAANGAPCQIALVLTLRTALATRSGRGRIYLPTRNIITVGSSGHLSSAANLNTVCDKLRDYCRSVATGGIVHVVVVSQTHSFTNPVTSISADDIPDTQRRRRNKLVGTVHTATV
jgi:hypothetical protein